MIDIDSERAAMRVIAFLTTLALTAAAIAAIMLSGCATFGGIDMESLDAHAARWVAVLEAYLEQRASEPERPPVVEPGEPSDPHPQPPSAVDAVAYSSLKWRWGGFNGGGAKLDSPRISNLRTNGRTLTYKWDTGLSGWGLAHGDAGAICAVFFARGGEWVGGKFDWVSTSRTSRELKHVESYNNWPQSGITLPHSGRVAFVVVSADGKLRSNVVVAEAGK